MYLLSISFLLQGCYSYKTVDLKTTTLNIGKTYKITHDNVKTKARLISSNDSIITVKKGKHEEQIPVSGITKMKMRKFSVVKTVLLPVGIMVTTVGFIILTFDFRINYGKQ
jgi:hypothetical protein